MSQGTRSGRILDVLPLEAVNELTSRGSHYSTRRRKRTEIAFRTKSPIFEADSFLSVASGSLAVLATAFSSDAGEQAEFVMQETKPSIQ